MTIPPPFEPQCPIPLDSGGTIRLAHGDGGRLTQELIQNIFLPHFSNPHLSQLSDSAVLPTQSGRVAFTTDSYVVQPLFFPGGDIGSLAIHGTVNDLAMMGATPTFFSTSFILEEGLKISTLQRVVKSMGATARACGIQIVCGDTKVVERGKGDQIFINTTGVGAIPPGVDIGPHRITPDDRIILSGDVGAHGIAVLSMREGLEFSGDITTDSAPLHAPIADLLDHNIEIHCLRDLTRGGLASGLHELATTAGVTISLQEAEIPIHEPVRGACEILGLDPLYIANEGRFVLILPRHEASRALSILHDHTTTKQAALVGEVLSPNPKTVSPVTLRTAFGTTRILDLLSGEQLPRIC